MKKSVLSLALVICLLLAALSLGGCGGKQRYRAESFDFFDTVTTVIGYADSKEAFDAEVALIFEELGVYHRLFDIYHAYEGMENLYTVNEVINGAHRTVTVERCVIDLLLQAKELSAHTAGAFNVGMGSVLSIWHRHREAAKANPDFPTVPSDSELAAAAAHTSLDALVIDEKNNTVTIMDPLMTLDVGAIAKGFATERVAAAMAARGTTGYILNVGGTVRTVGARADGEAWVIGIENPDQSAASPYLAEVAFADKALSTSGTYQRYYTANGVRYYHIIDPKTNQPARGYTSVSVIADDTALADALSTALFCMSIEAGEALLAPYPDAAALWLRDDGTTHKSARFDEFLKQ